MEISLLLSCSLLKSLYNALSAAAGDRLDVSGVLRCCVTLITHPDI